MDSASPIYVFGSFRLDPRTYQLTRDGDPVPLTSKAFDALLLLVQLRDRVVTKDELLKAVWPDSVVTEDSLIQVISSLRRALGDDSAQPHLIATVARRGYRFVAAVETITLEPAPETPAPIPATPPSAETLVHHRQWSPRMGAAAVAAGLAMLLLGLWIGGTRAAVAPAGGPLRFAQHAPDGTTLASGGALSPDGRHLAFVVEEASGLSRLWIRALDADVPRVLEGSEGATRPFWSPDSRALGFFADGRLKTIPASGGQPTAVTTVGPRPAGGTWGPDGRILFSTWSSGIRAVSATGGTVMTITERSDGESTHAWPQFLPDGDHFLFYIYGGENRGTNVASLSSPERRRVLDVPGAIATYSPDGYLLFARNGVLMAQPFDAASRTASGEPFAVATGNVTSPNMTNGTMISAAPGGLVAFGGATGEAGLVWYNRRGEKTGVVTTTPPLHNPILSSDEQTLFGNTYPPDQSGLWAVELDRGASTRLIPNGNQPMLSPDGLLLAFASGGTQPGEFAIPVRSLSPTGDADLLFTSKHPMFLTDWSRDDRHVVYQVTSDGTGQDVWVWGRATREPTAFLDTRANEIQGRLSPDGRWIAYASDDTGRWEVYVQPFPGGGVRQTISTSGGADPQWRRDGRELFFLAADKTLMAVAIEPGAQLKVGRTTPLFRPLIIGEPMTYRNYYAASADGQRFVIDVATRATEPISLLLWQQERSRSWLPWR